MAQQRIERVVFVSDQPSQLFRAGQETTGPPLSAHQLQTMVEEYLSPAQQLEWKQSGRTQFPCRSGQATYNVIAEQTPQGLRVTILPVALQPTQVVPDRMPSTLPPAPSPSGSSPPPPTGNEAVAGTSGLGEASILPSELQGFNWGAFLCSWIWAIPHRSRWGFFGLIPYIGWLAAGIILGLKGNEEAWKKRRWESLEQFKAVQQKWLIGGLVLWGVGGAFWIVVGGMSLLNPTPTSVVETTSGAGANPQAADSQTANRQKVTSPVTATLPGIDIPRLLDKDLAGVTSVLGAPEDWDSNVGQGYWKSQSGGFKVLILFHRDTKRVGQVILESPDGPTADKQRLLQLGSLVEGDGRYAVNFIPAVKQLGKFDGVAVIPSSVASAVASPTPLTFDPNVTHTLTYRLTGTGPVSGISVFGDKAQTLHLHEDGKFYTALDSLRIQNEDKTNSPHGRWNLPWSASFPVRGKAVFMLLASNLGGEVQTEILVDGIVILRKTTPPDRLIRVTGQVP